MGPPALPRPSSESSSRWTWVKPASFLRRVYLSPDISGRRSALASVLLPRLLLKMLPEAQTILLNSRQIWTTAPWTRLGQCPTESQAPGVQNQTDSHPPQPSHQLPPAQTQAPAPAPPHLILMPGGPPPKRFGLWPFSTHHLCQALLIDSVDRIVRQPGRHLD